MGYLGFAFSPFQLHINLYLITLVLFLKFYKLKIEPTLSNGDIFHSSFRIFIGRRIESSRHLYSVAARDSSKSKLILHLIASQSNGNWKLQKLTFILPTVLPLLCFADTFRP